MIRSFKGPGDRGRVSRTMPEGFSCGYLSGRTPEARHVGRSTHTQRPEGAPPANRLEALKRDRKGEHSIRINDQWRVCFRRTELGLQDVEIVDYH